MPDTTTATNGNGQQGEEFRIPDFVTQLIGRLQLENEALRVQLQMFQAQQGQAPAAKPAEPAIEVV